MTALILLALPAVASKTGKAAKVDWSQVIEAIIKVESEGRTTARNGRCVGPMQISPVMVRECNDILRSLGEKHRFSLDDRYDLTKSKEMFRLFQGKYNPSGNIEWAVRSWNGGPKFSLQSTNSYYRKVVAAMND